MTCKFVPVILKFQPLENNFLLQSHHYIYATTEGKDAVGSLIVFRNGLPYKNSYRRFKIKTVTGIDDYAMIKEIMTRRYKRLLEEKGKLPDLILIDGGKGQYNIAVSVLKELGLGNIKVVALAKSKDSLALNLLKRVRDEAHRFAIAYHRKLRKL